MLDVSRDRVPTRECLELLVHRIDPLRRKHPGEPQGHDGNGNADDRTSDE